MNRLPAPLQLGRKLAALALLALPAVPVFAQQTVTVITSFPKELTAAYKAAFEKRHPAIKLEILNKNTVASACHIDFLAPAREGDILEAEAVEQSLSGRTGVYDVTVRTRTGRTVALFRGKSYRINGEVIAGLQHAEQAR